MLGDGVVTWDEFRLKCKEDNETKTKDSTELGKFAFIFLWRCRPQLFKTLKHTQVELNILCP